MNFSNFLLAKKISNFFRRKKLTNDVTLFIDESYLASWTRAQGSALNLFMHQCRLGEISEEDANAFFKRIETNMAKKWNDHKIIYDFYEPLEVTYKYDKITDYGLSLFCGLIVTKPLQPISHMGLGEGIGPTLDYQGTLYSEKVRNSFLETGYINSEGKTLRFHSSFDIMMPNYEFTEMGLFNNPDFGVGPLIGRAEFNPAISHTSGLNYITGSYLISALSG